MCMYLCIYISMTLCTNKVAANLCLTISLAHDGAEASVGAAAPANIDAQLEVCPCVRPIACLWLSLSLSLSIYLSLFLLPMYQHSDMLYCNHGIL